MIFTISLIILIVFTLPLTQTTIEDTLDVSDSINVKSDLVTISQAIKEVYGQGQGSKQQINLNSDKSVKISVGKNQISCSLKLKDKSKKSFKESYNSNLKSTSIKLDKGENIIVVEWPVGSKNMIIYKK